MLPIVGLTVLAQAFYARAQYSTARCLSQYSWMLNSLAQSPCRVAEFLSYPCHAYTFVPLNGSQYYSAAADNSCECNTVMYNIVSACSICQGGSQQGWRNYSSACSHTYIGQYPEDILSTTAIPHWAYIDISGTNVFDTNQALSVGDEPETTKGLAMTSVSTVTVSVTQSATSGSNKSSKSIAGPVVGGVIGGLALVALVVGGILFWIMRRGNSQGQHNSRPNILGSPSTIPSSPGVPSGGSLNHGYTIAPALRIYEPYDPQPPQTVQANNNIVSMYVTPASAYKSESPAGNMYVP
ncbi:hypothetical protein AX15_007144 [Amanita polypyramis BW_CC]|nr:hypothetical protein AX15_007144 [Amanita polypyramis BW_CC]